MTAGPCSRQTRPTRTRPAPLSLLCLVILSPGAPGLAFTGCTAPALGSLRELLLTFPQCHFPPSLISEFHFTITDNGLYCSGENILKYKMFEIRNRYNLRVIIQYSRVTFLGSTGAQGVTILVRSYHTSLSGALNLQLLAIGLRFRA